MVIALFKFKLLLGGFEYELRKEITAEIPINTFHKLQYVARRLFLNLFNYGRPLTLLLLFNERWKIVQLDELTFSRFCFVFYGHFHLQVAYQYRKLVWFTGSCKL